MHSIQLGKKGKTISVKYHFLPTVSTNGPRLSQACRVPLFLGPSLVWPSRALPRQVTMVEQYGNEVARFNKTKLFHEERLDDKYFPMSIW